MCCDDLTDEVLVDLVDGVLAPSARGEIERHLEECATCRALVMDLRTIRAAAFTLDRPEPRPEVWTSLKMRVAGEPRPSQGVGRAEESRAAVPDVESRRPAPFRTPIWRRGWLAAAAVLLAATLASLLPLTRSAAPAERPAVQPPAAPASPSVESIAAEFEAAEAHYQKAITDLETIAREGRGALDPQVAAVLQKNLTLIDQAISESRAALGTQPSNTSAQTGLFDALRAKLALLQQTVELINEMRQGNQAEAGRALQSLSR